MSLFLRQVGYGDMVPVTVWGKLIGCLCAINGVLLVSVTLPVFINNFLLFHEHSKLEDSSSLDHTIQRVIQQRRADVNKDKGQHSTYCHPGGSSTVNVDRHDVHLPDSRGQDINLGDVSCNGQSMSARCGDDDCDEDNDAGPSRSSL